MTTAPAGPTQLFSTFSGQADGMYRTRHEAFLFSLLGQALILGIVTYFTCCLIGGPPRIIGPIAKLRDLPLVFSGSNGGGGGNFDKLPGSRGNPPRASLDDQIVPPNVMMPTEMPKLPAEETVRGPRRSNYPKADRSAIRCRSSRAFYRTDRADLAASESDVAMA